MNAASLESPTRRSQVVCVNSSLDLLEMICTLLEEEGYEATGLRLNGHPVDKIASIRPDALVIDLVPNISESWELIEQINANPSISDIPKIVISTEPTALEQLQCDPERYGESRVMTKPFDVYELCSVLNEMLQVPADEGA